MQFLVKLLKGCLKKDILGAARHWQHPKSLLILDLVHTGKMRVPKIHISKVDLSFQLSVCLVLSTEIVDFNVLQTKQSTIEKGRSHKHHIKKRAHSHIAVSWIHTHQFLDFTTWLKLQTNPKKCPNVQNAEEGV